MTSLEAHFAEEVALRHLEAGRKRNFSGALICMILAPALSAMPERAILRRQALSPFVGIRRSRNRFGRALLSSKRSSGKSSSKTVSVSGSFQSLGFLISQKLRPRTRTPASPTPAPAFSPPTPSAEYVPPSPAKTTAPRFPQTPAPAHYPNKTHSITSSRPSVSKT
jgi:hypothetical protein